MMRKKKPRKRKMMNPSPKIIYQELFDEISVYFSEEEWGFLKEEQKELYREVMIENYQILKFLGHNFVKPPLISKIEHGKQLYVQGLQKLKKKKIPGYVIDEPTNNNAAVECKISLRSSTAYEGLPVSEVHQGCSHFSHDTVPRRLRKSIITVTKESNPNEERTALDPHKSPNTGHPSAEYAGSPLKKRKRRNRGRGESRHKKMYVCIKCGKENFRSESAYITHYKTHIKARQCNCSEGEKCFICKPHLDLQETIKAAENVFDCPICGNLFSSKSQLLAHHKTHVTVKPFVCPECGRGFARTSLLVRHQRIHTGEKPFPCPECGKSFSRASHLVVHQRSHKGDKLLQCPECGKCLSQHSVLLIHQKIHTGEKPYVCPECGKGFREKSKLNLHLRTHTGEKPFKCSECSRSFTCRENLCKHQRIHTGEKPYECSECGRSFSRKSHLTNHQRIHTRM